MKFNSKAMKKRLSKYQKRWKACEFPWFTREAWSYKHLFHFNGHSTICWSRTDLSWSLPSHTHFLTQPPGNSPALENCSWISSARWEKNSTGLLYLLVASNFNLSQPYFICHVEESCQKYKIIRKCLNFPTI